MCGIVGVLGELNQVVDKFVSGKILDTLACRGPDNQTFWISDKYSLGHTRLSIIGLDASSNQPFSNPCSEWIMTFNGEIYNYKELRETLIARGYVFETNSDTEVLFKGFLEYGTNIFSKIRGMFAVAFFNPKTGRLILARDFSGEKPLYFLLTRDSVVFSSCVASIQACFKENLSVCTKNVEQYLHYQFVPSHLTVFNEVRNLNPGSIVEVMIPAMTVTKENINPPITRDIHNVSLALDQIRITFRKAVERTLVADVPIAISLSGGIDSVSIAAQIREIDRDISITSFTAGYAGNFDFDERKIAKKVAKDLRFEHVELEITKSEFIKDFPRLIKSMNSPIADLAAYPQFRIAESMNKQGFKVGIMGIGGDELFWGYEWAIDTIENSKSTNSIKEQHRTIPTSIKEKIEYAKHNLLNGKYTHLKLTPEGYPVFYEQLGDFNSPFLLKREFLNIEVFSQDDIIYDLEFRKGDNDSPEGIFQSILCDNWLTCNSLSLVDSLGMQNSVEYRLPFLDLDLIALSRSLNENMFNESKNKNLLRQALSDLVPIYVRDRAKSGFRFPSNLWLPDLIDAYEVQLTSGELVNRDYAKSKEMKKLIRGSRRIWAKQFFLYKLLVLEFYLHDFSKQNPHE